MITLLENLRGGGRGEEKRKKERKWLAMFVSIPEVWRAVDRKEPKAFLSYFLQHFKDHISWKWMDQLPYNLTE